MFCSRSYDGFGTHNSSLRSEEGAAALLPASCNAGHRADSAAGLDPISAFVKKHFSVRRKAPSRIKPILRQNSESDSPLSFDFLKGSNAVELVPNEHDGEEGK